MAYRQYLEDHLIDRPIPGRNQAANPDWLFEHDLSVVEAFLLFQLFQRLNESIEVADRRMPALWPS